MSVVLAYLRVRPFGIRGLEVHSRGRNLALLSITNAVVQIREIGIFFGVIEPIVPAFDYQCGGGEREFLHLVSRAYKGKLKLDIFSSGTCMNAHSNS